MLLHRFHICLGILCLVMEIGFLNFDYRIVKGHLFDIDI
jgi:hypothetical protein